MSNGRDAEQRRLGSLGARGPGKWPNAFALVAAGVAALGVLLLLGQGPRPHRAHHPHRPAAQLQRQPQTLLAPQPPVRALPAVSVAVTVDTGGPAITIPRSFLGFSTEYWTLPVDEQHVALYRRVISLLHTPGDGRFVLRVGGVSSDHSFWQLAGHHLPGWAFAVTPRWIRNTARIVRQSRLRVIIDLNLVTATPALDAALAREAVAAFPHGSIAAFEIGNEPDVYNRHVWGFRLGNDRLAAGLLPRALTPRTYVRSFDADARALRAVDPRIALQGPALADPRRSLRWIARLLAAPHPRLDAISVHEYPYTACTRPGDADYPTIDKLLSSRSSTAMTNAVRPAVRLAHRFGMPVRVSEFNSVTCGGVAGISDSFATALWAPGALFALARAGVSNADLHVRAYSINAPFGFSREGLVPRPLLYGLILFARMVGADARLVGVHVQARSGTPLRVWAVRQPGHRINVLLIDRSGRPVIVDLRLPTRRRAIVQRLLAPSAEARSGETLDGQSLGTDLRWTGRKRVESIAARRGRFVITVHAMSAALVTVRTGSGARRARCRGCGRPRGVR